jgi:hypothetical protein
MIAIFMRRSEAGYGATGYCFKPKTIFRQAPSVVARAGSSVMAGTSPGMTINIETL